MGDYVHATRERMKDLDAREGNLCRARDGSWASRQKARPPPSRGSSMLVQVARAELRPSPRLAGCVGGQAVRWGDRVAGLP